MPQKLGIVFFPAYDWSIGPDHPEREERLLYTQDQLREEGLFDFPGIVESRPQVATDEDVLAAHIQPPGVERLAGLPHLISAGGAITCGRLVMSGECLKSFALVRPPGHHAMRVVHGGRGFCNINNEAIMIERLRREYGVRRVAIVDTDCHHGDGTQDIYWHDPDTLFISLHQDGRTLYPGSGFAGELGGPKALGSTINIPLPPETGDDGFLLAANMVVRPILDEWKPELVVNSAGQDNHFTDPITNMRITARGYGALSDLINPDIAVLEGGYAIKGALPYLNLAIAMSMAGLDWTRVEEPLPSPAQLATSDRNMEYIRHLCGEIHKLRRKAVPERSGSRLEGRWWVRERSIYYDTHTLESEGGYGGAIHEHQREELFDCPNCPGLLVIHTRSEVSPPSVHYVLPHQPCEACLRLKEDLSKT
ncbi:histone deacetylase [Deltaproteobacteria bacterium Smac51]|nr:histone deacetylase [Deltaproteobacteria bacterium Smac51]